MIFLILFELFLIASADPTSAPSPISIVDEYNLKHRNTLSVPMLASLLVGLIIFLLLLMKWMEKNYLFLRQYI